MSDDALQPFQEPAAALPRRVWDAAVVGAGPAGAAAAACLAAEGYHVLLLDREAFPRDKVCGDALLPDAVRVLGRLGLGPALSRSARTWTALSVWSPGRVRVDVPGTFLTLRRRVLDGLVAQRAVELGATFARGRVVGLEETGPLVRLRLGEECLPVQARFAVLATGARRETLRRLGLPVPPTPPDAVGVRCYLRSSQVVEHLTVSYGRSLLPGYGWIFPLGEGLYNVGCGAFHPPAGPEPRNLGDTLHEFLRSFPPARELLAGGALAGPPRAAPLRCSLGRDAPAVRGRVVLAGECLGTTLPFSGEGVGKALETGERAGRWVAEALRAADPRVLSAYGAGVVRELSPRYRDYRAAQRWLRAAWLCDLLAWRVRKSRYLQESLSRVVRDETSPHTVFSLSGIARSYLA